MNEKINIAEILKDCPKGTKLWSPLFGEVTFEQVYDYNKYSGRVHCIYTLTELNEVRSFTKHGLYYDEYKNSECLLFPSKQNRDWSTFKFKKPKFDQNITDIGRKIMNEKELNERLLKMEEMLKVDCLDINSFIWQNQEGQDDHFDNFNKAQKIAFIKLYSKVQELRDCLVGYIDWFVKK